MTDSDSAASAEAIDAATSTSSTLSKPAHTKLASSYYYFSSTPTHQASQYMPQLISTSPAPTTSAAASPSPTPIDSSSSTSPAPPSSSSTPNDTTATAAALPKSSAWNAAGTWEERDVSSWARTHLQALVLELAFPPHEHVRVSIESVKSCTGDASIIFTRGKKKVGFDLQFEAEWVGKHGAASAATELKGTLHVSGIQETAAGDYEITIKPSASSSSSSSNQHKEVIQFVHKHGKMCTASVIDRFVEELMRH